MEKVWILIKDGFVVNTIVAEFEFIQHLFETADYNFIVRMDSPEGRPAIGMRHTALANSDLFTNLKTNEWLEISNNVLIDSSKNEITEE